MSFVESLVSAVSEKGIELSGKGYSLRVSPLFESDSPAFDVYAVFDNYVAKNFHANGHFNIVITLPSGEESPETLFEEGADGINLEFSHSGKKINCN